MSTEPTELIESGIIGTASFPSGDVFNGIVSLAVDPKLDQLRRAPDGTAAAVYLVPKTHNVAMVATEQFHDAPDRPAGTTYVRDIKSFLAFFDKHASDAAEIHADHEKLLVTAVLNAPPGGEASFRDHRLVLHLKKSKAMIRWLEIDGKLLDQDGFAEFIEDNALDIIDPASSVMLDIATTLIAKKGLDFEQSVSLHNGQRVFSYRETLGATAGARGEIQIPTKLSLGLHPFEGGDPYQVDARFRYRLTTTGLRQGVKLDNIDRVFEKAFDELVEALSQGLTDGQIIVQGPAPEVRTAATNGRIALQ